MLKFFVTTVARYQLVWANCPSGFGDEVRRAPENSQLSLLASAGEETTRADVGLRLRDPAAASQFAPALVCKAEGKKPPRGRTGNLGEGRGHRLSFAKQWLRGGRGSPASAPGLPPSRTQAQALAGAGEGAGCRSEAVPIPHGPVPPCQPSRPWQCHRMEPASTLLKFDNGKSWIFLFFLFFLIFLTRSSRAASPPPPQQRSDAFLPCFFLPSPSLTRWDRAPLGAPGGNAPTQRRLCPRRSRP